MGIKAAKAPKVNAQNERRFKTHPTSTLTYRHAHTPAHTHTYGHAHIHFNTHITREDNACKQMANGGRQKAYRLNCWQRSIREWEKGKERERERAKESGEGEEKEAKGQG